MLTRFFSRSLAASADRTNPPTYNHPRAARRLRRRPTSTATSPPAASDAHIAANRLGAPPDELLASDLT